MIERLPTPWGLVRSGVAPGPPEDQVGHPHLREDRRAPALPLSSATSTFGSDVSREDLLEHYHAIVYAIGSPGRPAARVPGEDLPGSHAATEFVGWYNGHPDHTRPRGRPAGTPSARS